MKIKLCVMEKSENNKLIMKNKLAIIRDFEYKNKIGSYGGS